MTGPDASSGEMPGFPFPRRPAAELDETLLDALLTGGHLPPGAPEQARTMADMLASLADPATPGALAGEAAARTAFARAAFPAGISSVARTSRWRRRRPGSLTARIAAALAAAAIALGGAAAAAYAGVLPGPIQDFAHQAIGAPAPHRTRSHPRATLRHEPSVICTAYQRARALGPASAAAADRAKLARAAGGAARIDSYCAAAQRPGAAAPKPGGPRRAGPGKAHGKAKARAKANVHPAHKPHPKHKTHAAPKHAVHPVASASAEGRQH
jgi:hypothetical protein